MKKEISYTRQTIGLSPLGRQSQSGSQMKTGIIELDKNDEGFESCESGNSNISGLLD